MNDITEKRIENFKNYLQQEEKSDFTLEKYLRDVKKFAIWTSGRTINKTVVIEYKNSLIKKYAPATVNSVLSSLNSFFEFSGWRDMKIKMIKIQRQIFIDREKELTKEEYEKLLEAAKTNKRLYYLIQTICSTGIRVSELKYITVEAVKTASAVIKCKGKMRQILLPKQLCVMLNKYIHSHKITKGAIFVSRNGKPLDRSNIWKMLKDLCKKTNVLKEKVFPHNFRHLFARTYYSMQKDIVRLADILGHSNVNTTRIYTMETGEIHRKQIQKLGLLRN